MSKTVDACKQQIGLFGQGEPLQDMPLALKVRPMILDDYVGQERAVKEITAQGERLGHLILWGPPGTGKTTLAHIIAHELKREFFPFNAVLAGVPELKKLIQEILDAKQMYGKKSILFIDEIHRFNKAQQDALLPYLERGDFLFIGATTEYPQTSLNRALLSRVRVLELKAHNAQSLHTILKRAQENLDRPELEKFLPILADLSNGDARRALNVLSMLAEAPVERLQEEGLIAELFGQNRLYDKDQGRHYDVISAFIKSVRGSDPDGALLWLAVMLDGGEDPEFIARRLMILASEDIGLANSQGLQVATNAHYVCKNIGMPEARITLSHATVFLALSPKSNSAYMAINEALNYVESNPTVPVPEHLSNIGPGKKNYLYPHSYPRHWVAQKYMPAGTPTFYHPQGEGSEKALNQNTPKLTP